MPKTAAIICEYNPMHLGHAYQIECVKKLGYDAVVGIMSGPFVQRGEPAVLNKWDRAKVAVQSGLDLVVELPQVFALESAEGFARGGVSIASLLGDVEALAFGVESGTDMQRLQEIAAHMETEPYQEQYALALQNGLSPRSAIIDALQQLTGQSLRGLIRPNNTLAIQYLRALRRLEKSGRHIEPVCIDRIGADYDDRDTTHYPSATRLRELLLALRQQSESAVSMHKSEVSDNVVFAMKPYLSNIDLKTQWSALDYVVEAALYCDHLDFACTPAYEPGMEHRIAALLQREGSVQRACEKAANKRHTTSRYRRMTVQALLGIDQADPTVEPHYMRPLALNSIGATILNSVDETTTVIHKPTLLPTHWDPRQRKLFDIDLRAEKLHAILTGDSRSRDYLDQPFIKH